MRMDRLSVRQCNNSEKPRSSLTRDDNLTPETDPAVLLDLAVERGGKDIQAPLTSDIWSLAQHLFFEIARRLHAALSV